MLTVPTSQSSAQEKNGEMSRRFLFVFLKNQSYSKISKYRGNFEGSFSFFDPKANLIHRQSRSPSRCGSVTLGVWQSFRLSFNTLAPLRYPTGKAKASLVKNGKIHQNLPCNTNCKWSGKYRGNFEIEFLNATRSCRKLLRVGAVGNCSQNLPIITLFLPR